MPSADEPDDRGRLRTEVDGLLADAGRLHRRITAYVAVLRRRVTRERLRRAGVSSAAQLDPTWGALVRRLRAIRSRRT